MAEEDFEIDIYGDANAEGGDNRNNEDSSSNAYENTSSVTVAHGSNNSMSHGNNHNDYGDDGQDEGDQSSHNAAPATQSFQQGVKRKEAPDDRPIDPGATNCLLLSDLQWWNSDDDIRGWAAMASAEEELKDITFSEHKVNGKSKGQAYIEFATQQAATATKHAIENDQNSNKKATVVYTNPNNNPFRTLPKDGPARQNKDTNTRGGSNSGYNDRGGMSGGYNNNFRGRGGYNRGGFNRNFSGGNNMGGGGFNNNNNMGGGGGGGFNMGGGNFGFNNRGNPMMGAGMRGGPGGMRGGRGGGMNNMSGMNNNNMMGNMMGGMGGMGGMGMPMGGMPGGMGMGFPQQPHFNPNFFGGNQQWDGNPHGAKRPRGE